MNPTFFPRLCFLIAALLAPLLAAPEKWATSIDAFVKADYAKWGGLVKAAGVEPE